MRVLHLFANWKWTGPAEPVVRTCLALRAAGVDAVFCANEGPAGVSDSVPLRAEALGLPVLRGPRLPKHAHPIATALDVGRVRKLLAEHGPFELIHCHLPNDHLIGGIAARSIRGAAKRCECAARAATRPASRLPGVPVVRTFYDGYERSSRGGLRERFLARWMTDLALAPSEAAGARLARYGKLEGRIARIEMPIELSRFDPESLHAARPAGRRELRAAWGIPEDAPVFGLVARIQRRRRFDLLIEAAAILAERAPIAMPASSGRESIRIVVIGRGTHQAEILEEPIRARGLGGRLKAVGYFQGEDYPAALAALDALIFLVPGTDGTCRTVREAMAMGLPVVATRLGILPELVEPERTGLLVDEDPESLAAAIARLAADPGLRAVLGTQARCHARERFNPSAIASTILARYEALLS